MSVASLGRVLAAAGVLGWIEERRSRYGEDHCTLVSSGVIAMGAVGSLAYWRYPVRVVEYCSRPSSLIVPTFVHANAGHFLINSTALLILQSPLMAIPDKPNKHPAAFMILGSCIPAFVAKRIDPRALTIGMSSLVTAMACDLLTRVNVGPVQAPFGSIGLLVSNLLFAWRSASAKSVDYISHSIGALVGIVHGTMSLR